MLTMTPQARAVTVFVLAVLLLTGDLSRLPVALYSAAGGDLQGGDGSRLVLSLLAVTMAAAVLWFSHVTAQAGQPGWDTNLAQVARVLALIGIVVSVLGTIAVLTNDEPYFGMFSLGF